LDRKIEYLYLDLGTVTTIPAPALNSTTAVVFNSRITDNMLIAAFAADAMVGWSPEPNTSHRNQAVWVTVLIHLR
jgi:hypothetical protein